MANETTTANDLHVLIVDDDLDDLAMLSDSFRSLSGGHWKI
jgi:hypothetical protein